MLKRVKRMGNQVSRLTTIWVDGGFDGAPFMIWVMDFCRWIVQVVLRPEQTLMLRGTQKALGGGAYIKAGSWGVGDWSADVERLPETSETLIYLAMIRIMVQRLT